MTQSREQFEAHYDGWCNEGFQGYTESKRMGNSYKLPSIAVAWSHWQASRDVLVVALPVEDPLGSGPGDHGDGRPSFEQHCAAECNFIIRDCRDAIHAAGIKTNPST